MAPEMFEELEHTADWAIKVRGSDFPSLFVNAAIGMMDLAGVSLGEGAGNARRIELEADDPETLLVDWLSELVVSLELEAEGYRDFEIEVSRDWRLTGTVTAVPIQSMEKPIKAVTYNELQIAEASDHLEATVVFDV